MDTSSGRGTQLTTEKILRYVTLPFLNFGDETCGLTRPLILAFTLCTERI
jgi:hypothetical protein